MARKAKKVVPKTFSLERYLVKINKEEIRSDQDVQRLSGQFSNATINELIVTVLTDDYIPEIVLGVEDGTKQTWIIDGLQRSSSLIKFRFGNYKITSAIEDSIIEYEKQVIENGQVIKDENGNIIWETVEFDIKGKSYSDLPEELKDVFNEYQIKTVIYNGTMKHISKLVRRLNNHTGMNAIQKAFTYIDDFARDIRGLVEHRFFKDCGIFTESEKRRGIYNRVVCESVMAMFHLDKWKVSPKAICSYLNKEGVDREFETLEKCLDRLELIIDKGNELFNAKNAFIWITLFYKFTKLELSDDRFVKFTDAFNNSLHRKEIQELDGMCFDEYDKNKGTKDKKVVLKKIETLEKLLLDFLHIDKEELNISDLKNEDELISVIDFVRENVDKNTDKLDIDIYEDSFKDYLIEVSEDSKLLEDKNINPLMGIVAYAFNKEQDNLLPEWFSDFFKRNNTYIKNQKKNYIYMKNDLDNFIQKKSRLINAS